MAEKTGMTPTQRATGVSERLPARWNLGPLGMMQRFTDEIDRLFEDFGVGHRWSSSLSRSGAELWAPQIDVFQRSNELVIRADLPGMSKEDVKVDVTEDALTIEGERRSEREEERQGVYRSERSYGSFHRVVPLPPGTITDQAKASFRDGVLEITMPTPPEQVTRGRRLEISEGSKK
jgi:HSP20 family protein